VAAVNVLPLATGPAQLATPEPPSLQMQAVAQY
jgi:hypothetical protein